MESVRFELSGQGAGDAAAFEEKNFVFVVGGVEYRCCRFQACLVSSRVRRLLASDCCISRVCLNVMDDEGHFRDIVSLMNGKQISITNANAAFLASCARELENGELLDRINSFNLDGDVSMSNVVNRIRMKSECHSNYKSELDFVASHFFEVELSVLKCLSVTDLEMVLLNPLLKLESEDKLYDTIIALAGENGDDVLVLLRHLQIEFLSETKLGVFLNLIFPDLVSYCWGSLCECLHRFCGLGGKEDVKNDKRYRLEFETFTSEKGPFNGIVQHLRGECGGNPHEKGVISITASGTSWQLCHYVVNYDYSKWWISNNQTDAFIQFDFKSKRVCLSQYTLKSDGNSGWHLLSWALEVSDDGLTWEAVDERNTNDLDGKFVVKTYECSNRSDRFVRFVRLRLAGKNSSNDDTLQLAAIEFFGQITK